MNLKKLTMIFILMVLLFLPLGIFASDRPLLNKPATKKLTIEFNHEKLKGLYNFIDARSEAEKNADMEKGRLNGSVLVFLTGHAQRPADAFKFTNDLALKSRSGIVVVPVCDTPYGKEKSIRGDQGKTIVLMEMIRHILSAQGIKLDGYHPISHLPVHINKGKTEIDEGTITGNLTVIGWSHGCLLSRRLASAYPETIVGLGQTCPAGYKKWKLGVFSLTGTFTIESLRISSMLFSKKAPDVMRAGFGITKGLAGDSFRGIASGILHIKPARMFRSFRDIKDCTLYGREENIPVKDIQNLVVIFAKKDSVMKARQTGVTSIKAPDEKEIRRFWETHYPEFTETNKNLTLKFLKGNHLAPIAYYDLYTSTILKHLGENKTN